MTIDECIYYETSIERTGQERNYTKVEHRQLAEWLEELKGLREYFSTKEIGTYRYNKGRADAIDDFVEAIKEECGYDEEIIDDCYFEIAKETLLRIAEGLRKEQ